MQQSENLTSKNFVLYAAKYYDNPSCTSTEEFLEDLQRIKYIKRLFIKYKAGEDIKERLILNHLVILYNVFEPTACTNMLSFKLGNFMEYLSPFLIFLGYMPRKIGDKYSSEISLDQGIINKLRKI